MSDLVGALVVAALLTVALSPVMAIFVYRGYRVGQRYRRLRETAVETPGTVRPGETAFVRGTVTAPEDPVTGPVSGDEAVLAGWVIREWCSTNSRYWMTKARGIEAGAIHLDGSGGTLALPDLDGREQTGTGTRLAGVGDPNVEGIELNDTILETTAFDTDTEIPTDESPPSRFTALEGSVGLDAPVNNGLLDLRRADAAVVRDGDHQRGGRLSPANLREPVRVDVVESGHVRSLGPASVKNGGRTERRRLSPRSRPVAGRRSPPLVSLPRGPNREQRVLPPGERPT